MNFENKRENMADFEFYKENMAEDKQQRSLLAYRSKNEREESERKPCLHYA